MKKSRIFVGAAALLLAAAGAFAAVNNHATQIVYYVDGLNCEQTTIEFSCVPGELTCSKFINSTIGTKFLYASNVAGPELPCSVELEREP